MRNPADIVFQEERPAAIVISHERSGTHFLMNAIADSYGYVSDPWVDLDPLRHVALAHARLPFRPPETDTNYYLPGSIRQYLLALANRPIAALVKSHHPAEFFAGELEQITKRYVLFVIHRHPADTLLSFWRFVGGLGWCEGPKVGSPIDFARSEPCGALLRYQIRQHPTMMQRWAAHAESWLAAATTCSRVVLVNYEQLKSNYADVIRGFAEVLGREPISVKKPDHQRSTWLRVKFKEPGGSTNVEALRDLCRQTVGETMKRLGYD